MAVKDWSTSASSNATVGGIPISEGCAREFSNDADRAIMAEAKARFNEMPTAKDGSATGDGTTDDLTALQAIITAAEAANNNTTFFPTGVYKTTGTLTAHQGIGLIGVGAQGSNEACGVVFKHASTGNFITFDGNGTSAKGTGAKMSDMLIVKDDNYQGGIAINIVATSDNFRPGEMLLDRILTYGVGSTAGAGGTGGLWSKGLYVDGSACNTAGGRGVQIGRAHV